MAGRPEAGSGPENEPRNPLLVLGLGNVICTDDGVGPVAVALLRRDWEAPEGVRVEDGGTLGLALMSMVEEAETVILLDAVAKDGVPAGTLLRFENDEVPSAVMQRLSPHQIGVVDLLESLRLVGRLPPQIVLLGLVPESLELGVERTPAVAAALPGLVDAAVEEAARLGFIFRRRSARADPVAIDPAGLYGPLGV